MFRYSLNSNSGDIEIISNDWEYQAHRHLNDDSDTRDMREGMDE
jgi:hypothetical protein